MLYYSDERLGWGFGCGIEMQVLLLPTYYYSAFCSSMGVVPTVSRYSSTLSSSWVKALHAMISLMDQWMKQNNTDRDLRDCIYEYATGRGRLSMEAICIENTLR